jgi:hypothetical protein
METWERELWVMMEAIVDGIEEFVTEVAKEVESAVDTVLEVSEAWVSQLEAAIAPDLEQRLNEFLDPILEACLGLDLRMEETIQPVVNTVEPIFNDHPACVGCRHYHGQPYNGVMLVCGMHPFGWEEQNQKCPDWESFWKEQA